MEKGYCFLQGELHAIVDEEGLLFFFTGRAMCYNGWKRATDYYKEGYMLLWMEKGYSFSQEGLHTVVSEEDLQVSLDKRGQEASSVMWFQVLKEKEKNAGFVKPKPVKPQSGSSMRKASSTQSIDMGSNTTGSMRSINSNKSTASHNSMKRAQSTQNVSKVLTACVGVGVYVGGCVGVIVWMHPAISGVIPGNNYQTILTSISQQESIKTYTFLKGELTDNRFMSVLGLFFVLVSF